MGIWEWVYGIMEFLLCVSLVRCRAEKFQTAQNMSSQLVPEMIGAMRGDNTVELLYKDTSMNRTLPSVPNVIFVYLTTSEFETPLNSGHFTVAQ